MDYTDDRDLPEVTDELLEEALRTTRPYTIVVLKAGRAFETPGPDRGSGVTGLMPIVCPIADGSGVVGVCVFDATPDDVERIMSADPGVREGVFTYDVHPTRSFPGSTLPS